MYTPEQQKIFGLFYPYMFERVSAIVERNGRLVHYCSAEAAAGIISERKVWLRNVSCMNDFMEVEHGLSSLADAYNSEIGKRFKTIVDDVFPALCKEIESNFNSFQNSFRYHTYIACVSEHMASEDIMGRLSMWRAYGRTSGIALVLKRDPFLAETDLIGAYASPVRYAPSSDVKVDFELIVNGLENNRDFLSRLPRELVANHLFNLFRWAVLATKHPGFAEELEWRVVYNPHLNPSKVMERDVKTIGGVPQIIYKLPLKRFDSDNFSTDISDFVERVIIGPTQFPSAVREAFVDLLNIAGVSNSEERVFVSDIPLR